MDRTTVGMITVEEAKRLMMASAKVRVSGMQPLGEACGRVLAADVHARHDHPLFDMSAVDGYAIGGEQGPWRSVGSIAAGEVLDRPMGSSECARIFTGAQVPPACHAVLMQEHCSIENGMLSYQRSELRPGANIRRKAEGCRAEDVLLEKGTRLDPVGIGLLASSGINKVPVTTQQVVGIVRTGNEFLAGEELQPGRIFSSNEHMLQAALQKAGYSVALEAHTAEDTHEALSAALQQAIKDVDIVITTGGASVGDHDLIRPVLEALGATIHFHGVAQKPGKPMLFATLSGVPVFALPGNPRAVMVLFWEYVLPFLRAQEGLSDPWPRTEHLPLSHTLQVKNDRAEFRAATVRNGTVTLLADEGSHLLRSLIDADALAYLPPEQRSWKTGDAIEVHHIPR